MMIPPRCFSCGKPVGGIYEKFVELVKKGEDPKKALDKLGTTRYCCRRMILSQLPLIDDVIRYSRGK